MFIQIASSLFDPLGVLSFEALTDGNQDAVTRRFTKVATTDGGVATTDRGFSHGDREFVYRYTPISQAHDDLARRMLRVHALVRVSNNEGVFSCAPVRFEPSAIENVLTLSVISKLSED